jgi:hypothetical protein
MVIIYKIIKLASEGRIYDCSPYGIPQGWPETKHMDLVLGIRFNYVMIPITKMIYSDFHEEIFMNISNMKGTSV